MTVRSHAASAAARELWARVAGDSETPAAAAAAATRVCTVLDEGLSRWIGVKGFRALFDRALAMSRPEHPSLDGIGGFEGGIPSFDGTTEPPIAAEVGAGMMALVGHLTELLGRIVGDEMAVHLVRQACMPGPRLVVNIERKRARSG